jgi:hypothetical protein
MTLTEIDRKACRRAIDMIRQSNAGASLLQLEEKLAEDGFEEAGLSAAYSQQMKNLHLRPWQSPPCWIDPADVADIIAAGPGEDDTHGRYDAARLLKRLLKAGLSRFEPDPANALLKVKRPAAV